MYNCKKKDNRRGVDTWKRMKTLMNSQFIMHGKCESGSGGAKFRRKNIHKQN